MEPKRLYVDFHVLQTVPPSCVNRDDTGSPKTAVYGGTTRARVSSQAWKRAMRLMFRAELLDGEQVGDRTKRSSGWWRMRSKPWRRGRMQKDGEGCPELGRAQQNQGG